MRYSLDQGRWLFRQFDTNDDETSYRLGFSHWVRCGERTDFAVVEVLDRYERRGREYDWALLAARHVGVDLRSLTTQDVPAHVHLLSTPADLRDAQEVDPATLSREFWLTVEPVDWRGSDEAARSAELNRAAAAVEFERWRAAHTG